MDHPLPEPSPLPDPARRQPEGISNRARRWMFLGVIGLVSLIVLANIIGSPAVSPGMKTTSSPAQQQNPSAAEIRETEAALRQQQAELLSKTAQDAMRLRQLQQQPGANPNATNPNANMDEQLARLQDAQARAERNNPYGAGATTSPDNQKAQLEAEQRGQERKALFADNIVRQERPAGPSYNGLPAATASSTSVTPGGTGQGTTEHRAGAPVTASTPAAGSHKPLDFDPQGPAYWLPEGTVIEAVLTNRLDGDGAGPVNCMVTTDVYLPGTRLCVIPQGSRVLGEASKVSATGQQRLAVAFHRIIVPGLHEYSIPLDSHPPALSQAGEVGLHDKVNSHYAQIFGASLAIGAIGGLAQIGNGQNGFGYDPSVQFRNGITSGMTQSSERILDRFLNRLPTITIREGTRTRILLTDDLKLPAYERTNP